MAIIGIKYDEFNNLSYQNVYIHLSDKSEKVFDSGNFVKDWFNAIKYYITELSSFEHLLHSSSVNHFIMDGAKFNSAYMKFNEDDSVELVYQFDPLNDRIELFVQEDQHPTWEELKEYCKTKEIKS